MGKFINDNEQNMVLILTRKQTVFDCKEKNIPLEAITEADIWPVLHIAMANAEVTIIMDGKEFHVIKHRYMAKCSPIYNINELTNIVFAR